ncbi:MAG: hypothetical protein QOF38_2362 [Pseudonocardiales bacterium]|nr:hypothetical protein [Pseudonocardiales bacterium]
MTPTAFAECQFRHKEFSGARLLSHCQDAGEKKADSDQVS